MIIHDLKHPTEALAEGLHGLSKSLKVQKSEAKAIDKSNQAVKEGLKDLFRSAAAESYRDSGNNKDRAGNQNDSEEPVIDEDIDESIPIVRKYSSYTQPNKSVI